MTSETKETNFEEALEEVKTLEDLQEWSEALCASGLLDESEQTSDWGPRGPMAPWDYPSDAEVIWDNCEDHIVRLPSGELARWTNSERAWSEAQPSREFEAVLNGDPGAPDVHCNVEVYGDTYAVAEAVDSEDGPYWVGQVDELPLVEYQVTSDLFGPAFDPEIEDKLEEFVEDIQEEIPGLKFTALNGICGALQRSHEANDFLDTYANLQAWEAVRDRVFG